VVEGTLPLGNKQFYQEEDYHEHAYYNSEGEAVATIEFEAIEDEGSGKLWCETRVEWHLGNITPEVLTSYERVNLYNPGGEKSGYLGIATRLKGAVSPVDWATTMKEAVHQSIEEYRRSSSSSEWLTEVTEEEMKNPPFLLDPFVLAEGVTILYGPLGAGKSLVALAIGFAISLNVALLGNKPETVGKILYVDFEDDSLPHRYRMSAIKRAIGYEGDISEIIHHERITGSLRDASRKLRRIIREGEFSLVIVDSVGLARAGDVSASDSTIKLFKALRFLGTPVLALDHIRKEVWEALKAGRHVDPEAVTAIGSQFTMSSARLAWFLRPVPSLDPLVKHFNLYNTKANHLAPRDPFGLTVTYENNEHDRPEKIHFATDETLFQTAMKEDATRIAIAKTLVDGTLTGTAVSVETMIKTETVRKAFSREMKLDEAQRWFTKGKKVGRDQYYQLTDFGGVAVTFHGGENHE
jgi:hypothetical protein